MSYENVHSFCNYIKYYISEMLWLTLTFSIKQEVACSEQEVWLGSLSIYCKLLSQSNYFLIIY